MLNMTNIPTIQSIIGLFGIIQRSLYQYRGYNHLLKLPEFSEITSPKALPKHDFPEIILGQPPGEKMLYEMSYMNKK